MKWALLDGVPEEERERFLGIAKPRSYRRGEVTFLAGAPAESLQLIVSGWVAVRAGTEGGDMALLSVMGAGDFFGDIALFNPEWARTATVTALRPRAKRCRFTEMSSPGFEQCTRQSTKCSSRSCPPRSGDYRRSSSRQCTSRPKTRVYRRVLDAAEVWGGSVKGTVIPLTQEDVAENWRAPPGRPPTAHCDRPRSAGLLRIRRGRIELLDPKGIAHLARVV